MRAVVLDGKGNYEAADKPRPVAGRDELVIEPVAVGVCGTDLHLVIGDYPTAPAFPPSAHCLPAPPSRSSVNTEPSGWQRFSSSRALRWHCSGFAT
jgi:hypothetical protein